MKTTIRALATVLLSLLYYTSFAQTSFYLRIGGNLSKFYTPTTSFAPLLGGQAGIMADVGISDHFSIQPSLMWVAKGTSSILEARDVNGLKTMEHNTSWRLNYLELPVVTAYKAKIGKSVTFMGGLGGYVALGISGILRWDGAYDDQKVQFVTRKNSTSDGYNRYDYGAEATTGLQFNRLMVLIHYSHGIPENFVSDTPNVLKSRNRTLGVSAAYRLGKF